MFTGYLQLGGIELANTERMVGYATSAPCPASWWKQEVCGTVAASLGEDAYTFETIEEAPWYDPTRPELSSGFYGVSIIEVEGRHNSSREVSVRQGIKDGGVLGDPRRATRELAIEALVLAANEQSLSYGLDWFNSQLDLDACGQHGDACGLSDLKFYEACPPEMVYDHVPELGEVTTNLFTNPNLAGDGTWAEVRRNYITNPRVRLPSGWGSQLGGTVIPSELNGRSAGLVTRGGNSAAATIVLPATSRGKKLYVRVVVAATANTVNTFVNSFIYAGAVLAANGVTSAVLGDVGEEKVLEYELMNPSPDTVGIFYLSMQPQAPGAQVHLTDVEVSDTPFTSPYSDGSTTPETAVGVVQPEDFRWRWLGAENASESVMEIERVRGLNTSSCVVGVSTWEGRPAARIVPTATGGAVARVSFTMPTGEVRASGTVLASVHTKVPLTGALAERMRLTASSPASGPPSPPNEAGSYPLRHQYQDLTSGYSVNLYHGGYRGAGDVWWTDIGLFAGEYTGEAFSGSSVDPGELPDHLYRWSGEVDNSPSERVDVDAWNAVPNYDEYAEEIAPITRFMHDVGVTSGMKVLEYVAPSSDPELPRGARISFTVTSERGYVYAPPVDVPLLAAADAYEDIARNIFTNPTADTAGPFEVIRWNHVSNPSLESNVTGWSISGEEVLEQTPVTVTGGRVSGELRAIGTWSMKATTTAAQSGMTEATVTYTQEVPANGREVRLGIWGAVADPSSTVSGLRAMYQINAGPLEPIAESNDVATHRSGFSYKSPGLIKLPDDPTAVVSLHFKALGVKAFSAYADAAMIIEG